MIPYVTLTDALLIRKGDDGVGASWTIKVKDHTVTVPFREIIDCWPEHPKVGDTFTLDVNRWWAQKAGL